MPWARGWWGEASGEEVALTGALALEYAFFLTVAWVWLHPAPLSVPVEIRIYAQAWAFVPVCALAAAWAVRGKLVAEAGGGSRLALLATANALILVAVALVLRLGSASGDGPLPEPAALRATIAWAPIALNLLAWGRAPAKGLPPQPALGLLPLLLGLGLLVLALPVVPTPPEAAIAVAGGILLSRLPAWTGTSRAARRLCDVGALAVVAWLLFDPHLHYDLFHQGGFLGPVSEIQHGGTLLVDAMSQYGVLWISLLAAVFDALPIPLGFAGFTALLSLLAIAWYALVYALLRGMGVSLRVAASALAVLFVFHFIGLGGALHAYPSLGPMRFGLPWLLLASVALRARRPAWRRFCEVGELGVVAVASLWSIETFVYTLATFGAIVGAECLGPSGRRAGGARLAARLVAAIGAILGAHAVFALGVRWRSGAWPDWGLYFALFRASAAVHVAERLVGESDDSRRMLPVGPWVAVMFVCAGSFLGCLSALPRARTLREESALAIVAGATCMAVAQFSMYVGSSVSLRLAPVSVAPIFVGAWWLHRLSRERAIGFCAYTALGLSLVPMGSAVREWLGHDSPFSLGQTLPITRVTRGCRSFPRCIWHPGPGQAKTMAAEALLREHAEGTGALLLLGGNGSATTETLVRTGRRNAFPLNAPFQDAFVPRNAHRIVSARHHLEPGDVVIYRLGLAQKVSAISRLERQLLDRACREFRCHQISSGGFFGVLRLERGGGGDGRRGTPGAARGARPPREGIRRRRDRRGRYADCERRGSA